MDYTIQIAEEFTEEFEEICNYILNELNALDAAYRLKEKVKYKISLLKIEPRMYTQINKLSKIKNTYRRIIVNNYSILYTIEETKKVVYVAHIYYGGRNYIDDLL